MAVSTGESRLTGGSTKAIRAAVVSRVIVSAFPDPGLDAAFRLALVPGADFALTATFALRWPPPFVFFRRGALAADLAPDSAPDLATDLGADLDLDLDFALARRLLRAPAALRLALLLRLRLGSFAADMMALPVMDLG